LAFDDYIVKANPQPARFFGYDEDEPVGEPIELLLPPRLYEILHVHPKAYLARAQSRAINVGL
jgi:PAS domain-containing protein